jgi:hypothetical protein
VDLKLTEEELGQLDAATTLTPVYPNWYIQNFVDSATAEALGRGRSDKRDFR